MAETKKTTKPKTHTPEKADGRVAAIIIRGVPRASHRTEAILDMLRLRKKNTCAVYPKTASVMGMIKKVKDYVTYGDIDDETYNILVQTRGQKDKEGKQLNHFHLSPPRGGFERKGIKVAFDNGGALGSRGAKINDLIKRMV